MADYKMTKQGVRDLGGNRRPPKDEWIPQYEYEVACGVERESLVLHLTAESARDASKQARALLPEYSAMTVLRVTRTGKAKSKSPFA